MLQLVLGLCVGRSDVEQVCLFLKLVLDVLEALLLRGLGLLGSPVQLELLQGLLAAELGLDLLVVHPIQS